MRMKLLFLPMLLLAPPLLASEPDTSDPMQLDVQKAILEIKKVDPGIEAFFDHSAAYAVFPSVGKGGIVVGGAYGKGLVIANGRVEGYTTLTQASVGLQLGAQKYSQFIIIDIIEGKKPLLFETKKTIQPKHYDEIIAPVMIAEGCLLSCTYCITHFARGTLRSFPIQEIVTDVSSAIKQGCKEIQLTHKILLHMVLIQAQILGCSSPTFVLAMVRFIFVLA